MSDGAAIERCWNGTRGQFGGGFSFVLELTRGPKGDTEIAVMSSRLLRTVPRKVRSLVMLLLN